MFGVIDISVNRCCKGENCLGISPHIFFIVW